MANYFKLLCLSFILVFAACQEGKEAGDLQGQWQLNGDDTKYIAFSGSVTVLRTTEQNKLSHQIFGNFQHIGDSLFIQCYSIEEDPADTVTVEEGYGFKPFNNIRLKIEAIDTDKLILSKDGRTWTFDKY